METFDSQLIKNPFKLVVVRCLILWSKFAKNRLSPGPAGELTALPIPLAGSWGKGGKGRWKGMKEGGGERRGGEGREGCPPE